MTNTERLCRLVQLGEQVRELAQDLELESIAFMAGMVVAESKWAHYQSIEDEAPEPRIRAVASSLDDSAQRHRSADPHRHAADAMSNVTQLMAYRKMQARELG